MTNTESERRKSVERDAESLKMLVKDSYGRLAREAKSSQPSCCGPEASCDCGCDDSSGTAVDYSGLPGYTAEANLGLGCGLPTIDALIEEGNTVLDLGSGAGNDAFVAQALVGPKGHVIGLDLTEEMIERANRNKAIRGATNVEFRLGDIEAMPVESRSIDVVISNCVLNLVPDKARAFCEIRRVLKPGGRFSVSDIVSSAPLPEEIQSAAALYAGCVAGALPLDEYLRAIREAGLEDVEVKQSRGLDLPSDLIAQYLSPESVKRLQDSGLQLLSVTVVGRSPAAGLRRS